MVGEITADEIMASAGVQITENIFKNKGTNVSTNNFPKGLADHLEITIHQYDAYGRMSK